MKRLAGVVFAVAIVVTGQSEIGQEKEKKDKDGRIESTYRSVQRGSEKVKVTSEVETKEKDAPESTYRPVTQRWQFEETDEMDPNKMLNDLPKRTESPDENSKIPESSRPFFLLRSDASEAVLLTATVLCLVGIMIFAFVRSRKNSVDPRDALEIIVVALFLLIIVLGACATGYWIAVFRF